MPAIAAAVEAKRRAKRKLTEGSEMIGSDHGKHEMAQLAEHTPEEPNEAHATRKERFHRIMAEHYAHGGMVDDDKVVFGEKQDFLSSEGNDGIEPKELAQEHEPEVESHKEDPMLKRRMRLRKVMSGLHK